MRITGKVVLKKPTVLFPRENALPPTNYSSLYEFVVAALRTSGTLRLASLGGSGASKPKQTLGALGKPGPGAPRAALGRLRGRGADGTRTAGRAGLGPGCLLPPPGADPARHTPPTRGYLCPPPQAAGIPVLGGRRS